VRRDAERGAIAAEDERDAERTDRVDHRGDGGDAEQVDVLVAPRLDRHGRALDVGDRDQPVAGRFDIAIKLGDLGETFDHRDVVGVHGR